MGWACRPRPFKLRFIYDRDKGICHLCDLFVPWEQASRDHDPPKSVRKKIRGFRIRSTGEHLAHKQCNERRATMTIEAFKALLAQEREISGG